MHWLFEALQLFIDSMNLWVKQTEEDKEFNIQFSIFSISM